MARQIRETPPSLMSGPGDDSARRLISDHIRKVIRSKTAAFRGSLADASNTPGSDLGSIESAA